MHLSSSSKLANPLFLIDICKNLVILVVARSIAISGLSASWKLEQLLVTCEVCLIAVGKFFFTALEQLVGEKIFAYRMLA